MKRSIFVLLIIFLASCQEEELLERQVTAKRLASELHVGLDVATEQFTVFIYDLQTNAALGTGATLMITSDGFVRVGGHFYNLEYLKSYQASTPSLLLYF